MDNESSSRNQPDDVPVQASANPTKVGTQTLTAVAPSAVSGVAPPAAQPTARPFNTYATQSPSLGTAPASPSATPPENPNPLNTIKPVPPPPSLKSKLLPESIKGFISTIVFIVSVLVVAMLINSFVFQSYYVDGTSMEPTLQNNDRLIIDKTAHTAADIKGDPYIPERGEIIVLDSSIIGVNGRQEQLIKRVVALPGERLAVQDGVATIYNKATPQGFQVDQSLGLKLSPTFTDDPIDVQLNDDELFVMGDNRAPGGSFDSREFGPIKTNQVEGRLVVRVFPFNRITIF